MSTSWSGSATGHLTTNNGLVTVSSVEKSALTNTLTYYRAAPKTNPMSGLGPVFAGGGKTPSPYNLNYACSDTTLIIKESVQGETLDTNTFKREEK